MLKMLMVTKLFAKIINFQIESSLQLQATHLDIKTQRLYLFMYLFIYLFIMYLAMLGQHNQYSD